MSNAPALKAKLDQLEAERLILTIELRTELLRAAKELMPEAIRQAKPRTTHNMRTGKTQKHHGSPALLRLIARLAMRNVQIEKREK